MARPNRGRSIGGEANLAERIAHERGRRGLSYEGLAKLLTEAGCAIAGSAIYKIEKAEPPRRVAVDELIALSRVFELSVDDLLTPMDVLEQRRAQELLKEMDEADHALFDAFGRVLSVYAEFLELAASAPELHDYVMGHRFAGGGDSDPDIRLFDLEDVPDYDSTPFSRTFADFYRALLGEAGNVAEAVVRANRKDKNGG